MQISPSAARRAVQVVAVTEALSWAGLLISMLFKYVLADDERGVQFFGPVHGAAFIAYVLTTLGVRRVLSWSSRVTVLALVCSVPPFASLAFELWADKTGRLAPSSDRSPNGAATERDGVGV
jgi:integral membrane protein